MATVEITKENFGPSVDKDGILILDFWASWCGPCRSFAPTFEAASNNHPDIVFGKVDTEDQQELAGYFQIRSIPTLMIFRDRVLLFKQPGALPGAALEEIIGKVKELDMEEVHREIAKHKAEEDKAEEDKAEEDKAEEGKAEA